jgi:nitrate reductase beta subunit
MKNLYNVTPHLETGWQVIRTENKRATRVFDNQPEAIQYAKMLTEDNHYITIYKRDHSIDKVEKAFKSTISDSIHMFVDPQIDEHNLNHPLVKQATMKAAIPDKIVELCFIEDLMNRVNDLRSK